MKTKFLNFIILLISMLATTACAKESKDNPSYTNEYIQAVEVLNKTAGKIAIDGFANMITIELKKDVDLTDVQIKLKLAEGVELVEPANLESVYNLTSVAYIKLKAASRNITYSVKVKTLASDIDMSGWTKTTEFGSLPTYITLYKATTLLNKKAMAYVAIADMNSQATFNVLGEVTGYKTPTQFYESNNPKYPVIMNAGYFWDGTTCSLICRDGKILAPNSQVVGRTSGTTTISYYPTRSAFGMFDGNVFKADWVFTTVTPGTTYAYSSPALNKSGEPAMPVPTSSYPTTGLEYKPKIAIGGGPVLIKKGEYQNTWEAELYDSASGIGATANNPRSAIGVTADNKLIFFCCEGRKMTPEVLGFTLQEVANILKQLGCVEAMNLDGGGSSCMLINGVQTIKPSDGKQRSVVTAVALK